MLGKYAMHMCTYITTHIHFHIFPDAGQGWQRSVLLTRPCDPTSKKNGHGTCKGTRMQNENAVVIPLKNPPLMGI